MTRGVACEHSNSYRMPCGKCRICAKKSADKTAEKRLINDKCERGHQGAWFANGRCKICAKQIYWRRRIRPDEVAKQRNMVLKNSRLKRGLPIPPYSAPKNCECCNREFGLRSPHLDHCHISGIFRGWLCLECNLGIGKLGDTFEGVKKAMEYLGKSSIKPVGTLKCV